MPLPMVPPPVAVRPGRRRDGPLLLRVSRRARAVDRGLHRTLTVSGRSVRDRRHLSYELVARQLTNHEVGDIRPRDAIAAPRDAFGHDSVAARPRSVREEDRPDGDPVEVPLLEFL